jgi:hypothetical protein
MAKLKGFSLTYGATWPRADVNFANDKLDLAAHYSLVEGETLDMEKVNKASHRLQHMVEERLTAIQAARRQTGGRLTTAKADEV